MGQPMNRKEFITKTSAKILAAMHANTEKNPDPQHAVDMAIKLWDALVAEGVVS